jgi:hypothetical protein
MKLRRALEDLIAKLRTKTRKNNMTPEEQESARKLAKSIKDPEALKIAQTIFDMHQDNYSEEARQKQWEEEIVQNAVPPLDLSQIAPSQHHLHSNSQLFVPEHIARYIQGCAFPLGDDERNMILTEMEKYHRTKPETIIMDISMDQTGKTYFFIPEVAKYETGFYYLHQP